MQCSLVDILNVRLQRNDRSEFITKGDVMGYDFYRMENEPENLLFVELTNDFDECNFDECYDAEKELVKDK